MKKCTNLFFTILLILIFTLSTTDLANAQFITNQVTEPDDITLGAGIHSGSSVGHLGNNEIGVTVQLFYGILPDIRTGVTYTYYFISENNLNANEINIEGHYFFRNRDNVLLYGLGGINISRAGGSESQWGDISTRRFGVNAGLGIEFEVGDISLFGESKFTAGGWNQLGFTAGARMRL